MWTKREKILTSVTEINHYIETINYFHYYKLGTVKLNKNSYQITIEEDTNSKSNETVHVWNFTFESISDLEIEIDFVLSSYLDVVEIEDDFIMFSLTNGYLYFKATGIKLGIPIF